MTELTLTDYKVNMDECIITTLNAEKAIMLTMNKVDFNVSFIYDIDTNPEILEDSGIGLAFNNDLQIQIKLEPFLNKNQVQADIKSL